LKVPRANLRTIKSDLEQALLHYTAFRKGDPIPSGLVPYLQLLSEVDSVAAFVDSFKQDRSRLHYQALIMFLEGKPIDQIALELKNKVTLKQIECWIYGNDQEIGLVGFTFETFVKLSTWCPFCDFRSTNGNAGMAPYPLRSRMCYHRELAWAEDAHYR